MPKALDCGADREGVPIHSLSEASSGRFSVITSSDTTYEIDLDERTLLRKPSPKSTMPGLMLKDETPVTLLHILVCTVGAQGRFVVDLRQFGAGLTTRATATVIEIARLDHHTPAGGGTT